MADKPKRFDEIIVPFNPYHPGQSVLGSDVVVDTDLIKENEWNPRARPVRWCPIWSRDIFVVDPMGGCAEFCGAKYVDCCKFEDHDPAPHEMKVRQPNIVADETVDWVKKYRKNHSTPDTVNVWKGGKK